MGSDVGTRDLGADRVIGRRVLRTRNKREQAAIQKANNIRYLVSRNKKARILINNRFGADHGVRTKQSGKQPNNIAN